MNDELEFTLLSEIRYCNLENIPIDFNYLIVKFESIDLEIAEMLNYLNEKNIIKIEYTLIDDWFNCIYITKRYEKFVDDLISSE